MTATGLPIKWRKNEAQIAMEQQFVLEQRVAGCDSLREIAYRAAQHFGYNFSQETVRTRLAVEIRSRVEPVAAEVKQLAITRCEAQISRLVEDLSLVYGQPARDVELCLKIEDRLTKAHSELAKLLGTYAAVAVDVTVATVGSVDDELNALAAELGITDRSS